MFELQESHILYVRKQFEETLEKQLLLRFTRMVNISSGGIGIIE